MEQGPPSDEFRKRAEAQVRKKLRIPANPTREEFQRLVHELEVHQIELEMQNDELRSSGAVIEESQHQFTDLYDFSPVGYVTLDPAGVILQINLTGAAKLGVERRRLINTPFDRYVARDDRDLFRGHLQAVFETHDRHGCELRIEPWSSGQGDDEQSIERGAAPFDAQLESLFVERSDRRPSCRTIITDITRRKRAEEALRQSEERYRLVVESALSGLVIVNREGTILLVNAQTEAMFGYRRDELLGRSIEVLVPERFRGQHPSFRRSFSASPQQRAMGAGRDLYGLRKDGSEFPIEIGLNPMDTSEGMLVLSAIVDITERKRAEEAVRAREQRLQVALTAGRMGTWEWNVSTGRVTWSPHLEAIHGLTPGTFGGTFEDFKRDVHPDDLAGVLASIQRFGEVRGDYHVTYRITRPDGAVRWLEAFGTMLLDTRGEPERAVGVCTDVTERKAAEDAIRHSEERFRLLVSGVKDYAIVMLDPAGHVASWNAGAERITGYREEEIIGRHFSLFYLPEDVQGGKPSRELDVASAQGRVEDENFRVRKDGSRFWANMVLTAIYDQTGAVRGFSKVTRDLTEHKRLEEEILKASKLESVGVLAGGIAHDFNNFLTALVGNLYLAKAAADPDSQQYKRLTEAEKICLRAQSLTQQLLTFARGGVPIKKALSIGPELRDWVAFALRGSNVEARFELAEDLWQIHADEGQISQVTNNLVINAWQAMPSGGTVTVRADNIEFDGGPSLPLPAGRYVRLTIEDHGVGISREMLPKIFDPFFTTKPQGSGLGLATSYSIIRKHGGHIAVESEEGVGTRVSIHLPASIRAALVPKASPEPPAAGRGGRLLFMDDEDAIREFVSEILTRSGYEVACAADADEAVDRYRAALEAGAPFDGVILDLTVQGGPGGKEAIERLLQIDPEVHAVVSSGYSNDPVMADFRQYGFRGRMTKPYAVEELLKVARRLATKDGRKRTKT